MFYATIKIIGLSFILAIIVSCATKDVKEYVKDGITIVENARKTSNKNFKYKLSEVYTVKNDPKNDKFILNFPGDRADLNSDLDNDLNLYVVDNKRAMILKFNSKGEFIKNFGKKGQGPGEFPANPIDLSVDNLEKKLYVFDNSGRLSIFDLDGNFIKFVNAIKRSARAQNFRMTKAGALFICETYDGHFGNNDFKLGNCLFNSNSNLDIKKKIAGEMHPFDIKKIDSENFGILFSPDNTGSIYIAQNSKKKYIIDKYNYDGTKTMSVRKSYNPIKRSKNSLSEIKSSLDKAVKNSGGMFGFKKLSKMKSVISQIFTDSHLNLWVSVNESLFDETGQEFDIFSKNGHFLSRIKTPELTSFKIKSKGKYLIAATSIQDNYRQGGKSEPVIKVFKLSTE